MFWPNTWIIKARGNRISFFDLAVLITQGFGKRAVENRVTTTVNCRAMMPGFDAFAARFSAPEPNIIIYKFVKRADGIGPAADAGNNYFWQTTCMVFNLLFDFLSDNALKIADHRGVGMRAGRGAE